MFDGRPMLVYLWGSVYAIIRVSDVGVILVADGAKIAIDLIIGAGVAIYTIMKCYELGNRLWREHKKRKGNA